LADCVRQY